MEHKPPAPDSLPQYLSEGIPKQDDADLRALKGWIDDLLTSRHNIDTEDIKADEGESIEAVEESTDGTVVIKKLSCGKDNCKCQTGELHGPYRYVVTRQGDSLDWDYKAQFRIETPMSFSTLCKSTTALHHVRRSVFDQCSILLEQRT